MKYVPLEEVKEFLKSKRYNQEKGNGYVLALSPTVIDELDTLQTIDLSIIDEMIEEEQTKERDTDFAKWIHETRITLLQELKEKLPPKL